MRTILVILFIIALLCVLSCSGTFYIKSSIDYPKTFIIDQNVLNVSKNEFILKYQYDMWDMNDYYQINIPYKKYMRKDIYLHDTLCIKPVLFNKFLKVKK